VKHRCRWRSCAQTSACCHCSLQIGKFGQALLFRAQGGRSRRLAVTRMQTFAQVRWVAAQTSAAGGLATVRFRAAMVLIGHSAQGGSRDRNDRYGMSNRV
jgi:hypothetical protein